MPNIKETAETLRCSGSSEKNIKKILRSSEPEGSPLYDYRLGAGSVSLKAEKMFDEKEVLKQVKKLYGRQDKEELVEGSLKDLFLNLRVSGERALINSIISKHSKEELLEECRAIFYKELYREILRLQINGDRLEFNVDEFVKKAFQHVVVRDFVESYLSDDFRYSSFMERDWEWVTEDCENFSLKEELESYLHLLVDSSSFEVRESLHLDQ